MFARDCTLQILTSNVRIKTGVTGLTVVSWCLYDINDC